MEERELRRYVREAFRNMDQETGHISLEEIAAYSSGKVAAPRSDEVKTHLAGCAECRERLEEFEQFAIDAQTPASMDLTAEWKALQRRLRPKKNLVVMRRWLPPIAAAIILAVGLSWILVGRFSSDPQRLLAKAYSEQRTSEFRLAGAAHAQVQVIRGTSSDSARPIALAEAEVQLRTAIGKNPGDAELLRLQGVKEMMTGHASDAVGTLTRASAIRPDDAGILADLGAAYALRGDVERRYSDYVTAVEYLGHSLRLAPHALEPTFNLALTLEKMNILDQALKTWREYLTLDPTSAWAKEAQSHISDLQPKVKSKETAFGGVQKDPAKFLQQPAETRVLNAEAYLISGYAQGWLDRFNSDEPSRSAVNALAAILKQKGDDWLTDVAASGVGPQMLAGLQKVASAETAQGFEAKLADTREAAKIFLQARSSAGVLRARFSELVFLHIFSHFPECLVAAAKLANDLEGHHYARMSARVEKERGVCAMRLGKLDEADQALRAAIKISREAGFNQTALDAENNYISTLQHIGLRSQIIEAARHSLDTFWSGSYDSHFFYFVADELREMASRDGEKYAALFLARSAAWAAQAQSNALDKASAAANLAVAAQAAGERDEAQQNLAQSDQLFSSNQIPFEYRIGPETLFARVENERGESDSALQRLEKLREGVSSDASLDNVNYYSALGEAYRKKGLMPEAKSILLQAIGLGEKRLLSKPSDRAGALKNIEESYRGLVSVTLAQPGGDAEGLRIWRRFRALDGTANPDSIQQPDATVLSYVELPDGFAGWFIRKDQVVFRRLPANAGAPALAARFLELCSDRASSWPDVRRTAEQLYSWMIAPFADQLNQSSSAPDQEQALIVELDGILSGIPVQALVAPDGRFLGERFLILDSVGYSARQPRAEIFDGKARALAIADPAVLGDSRVQFRPLPDSVKEADAVIKVFPSMGKVIKGPAATVDALLPWLASVDIVHFSGHGYVNGENGALLFASKDPNADYEPLSSVEVARQDWSHVRLVVLSACATAAGETRGPHNPDSLVRALTYAGAPRVIAGLWNVDSAATLELMTEFYTSLAQGKNPVQALRTAQLRMQHYGLDHPEWAHPYYWAGFQLYGLT